MFPSSGGDGPNKAPPGDRFEQLSGRMCWVWGKLAYHVGDYSVRSPRGAVSKTYITVDGIVESPPFDEPLK